MASGSYSIAHFWQPPNNTTKASRSLRIRWRKSRSLWALAVVLFLSARTAAPICAIRRRADEKLGQRQRLAPISGRQFRGRQFRCSSRVRKTRDCAKHKQRCQAKSSGIPRQAFGEGFDRGSQKRRAASSSGDKHRDSSWERSMCELSLLRRYDANRPSALDSSASGASPFEGSWVWSLAILLI